MEPKKESNILDPFLGLLFSMQSSLLYLALILCIQGWQYSSSFSDLGTWNLEILKQSLLKTTLFADFILFTLLIPYVTS